MVFRTFNLCCEIRVHKGYRGRAKLRAYMPPFASVCCACAEYYYRHLAMQCFVFIDIPLDRIQKW